MRDWAIVVGVIGVIMIVAVFMAVYLSDARRALDSWRLMGCD